MLYFIGGNKIVRLGFYSNGQNTAICKTAQKTEHGDKQRHVQYGGHWGVMWKTSINLIPTRYRSYIERIVTSVWAPHSTELLYVQNLYLFKECAKKIIQFFAHYTNVVSAFASKGYTALMSSWSREVTKVPKFFTLSREVLSLTLPMHVLYMYVIHRYIFFQHLYYDKAEMRAEMSYFVKWKQ